MIFTGIMECKDKSEFDSVMSKLKAIRNAKVFSDCLTITVDYYPSDTETEFEEEEAIARLTDIMESVEIHGFSINQ